MNTQWQIFTVNRIGLLETRWNGLLKIFQWGVWAEDQRVKECMVVVSVGASVVEKPKMLIRETKTWCILRGFNSKHLYQQEYDATPNVNQTKSNYWKKKNGYFKKRSCAQWWNHGVIGDIEPQLHKYHWKF